jgi:hypothetical protein
MNDGFIIFEKKFLGLKSPGLVQPIGEKIAA